MTTTTMATAMAMGKVLRRRFRPLQSRRLSLPSARPLPRLGSRLIWMMKGQRLRSRRRSRKLKAPTALSEPAVSTGPGSGQPLGAGSSAGVYTADMLQKLRASQLFKQRPQDDDGPIPGDAIPGEDGAAPALPDAESIRIARAQRERARRGQGDGGGRGGGGGGGGGEGDEMGDGDDFIPFDDADGNGHEGGNGHGGGGGGKSESRHVREEDVDEEPSVFEGQDGAGWPLVRHLTVVAASAPAVSVAGGLSRSEWRLLMCRRRTTRKTTRAGSDAAARMAAAAARASQPRRVARRRRPLRRTQRA